jgi:trk system potassium uptake protein TrkH|tara:strand:- start:307 stop:825 length:519 start_codon:yes stop_codon:yes gene_type:complete
MATSFRVLFRRKKTLGMPPPALLSLYYMAFIILGAVLLWMPISHHGDIGLGEALFTSTSAVTVTGLVLFDTGATFTGFGQAVIATLIQLGGLGLMTFAVLLLGALGIPIGMPQRLILREDLNQTSLSNLSYIARMILIIAVACEALGAGLGLCPRIWLGRAVASGFPLDLSL